MEHRPRKLAEFLRGSKVNRGEVRLASQALAGPALEGGELEDVSPTGKCASIARITVNWKSVVEDAARTPLERENVRAGERTLFDEKTIS